MYQFIKRNLIEDASFDGKNIQGCHSSRHIENTLLLETNVVESAVSCFEVRKKEEVRKVAASIFDGKKSGPFPSLFDISDLGMLHSSFFIYNNKARVIIGH